MSFILSIAIFFFAIVIHEYAHGLMAYWLGDRTAKYEGRLTLNPLAHIDPFGTLLLPMFLIMTHSPVVFGWAKPVPINYWGLRNPRRDIVLVGLAGPLANIAAAFSLSVILNFLFLPWLLVFIIKQALLVNLVLAVFNLMPIPPLDGSRVLAGLLPSDLARSYASFERWGFLFLIIILYLGLFDKVVWPIVGFLLNILRVSL